jgi:hypothetical protein
MSWGGVPQVPNPPARAQADATTRLGADREALSHALADRPAGFSVRAKWRLQTPNSRRARGRGTLLVSPGTVVFIPSGLTKRLTGVGEFSHTAPSITLVTARVGVPWASFLVLENDGSIVRIGVPVWARRRARCALVGSGLTVHEETSWRAPRLPVSPAV